MKRADFKQRQTRDDAKDAAQEAEDQLELFELAVAHFARISSFTRARPYLMIGKLQMGPEATDMSQGEQTAGSLASPAAVVAGALESGSGMVGSIGAEAESSEGCTALGVTSSCWFRAAGSMRGSRAAGSMKKRRGSAGEAFDQLQKRDSLIRSFCQLSMYNKWKKEWQPLVSIHYLVRVCV